MNCEKCKNKKATVFYADEGGGRHSLCANCASLLGKLQQYAPSGEGGDEAFSEFVPEPSLTSLYSPQRDAFPAYELGGKDKPSRQCSFCGTALQTLIKNGSAGCPECYSVFGEILFPSCLTLDGAEGVRMPSKKRAGIDTKRSIAELKAKIRLAVESENYELAAELRDKIKTLESKK